MGEKDISIDEVVISAEKTENKDSVLTEETFPKKPRTILKNSGFKNKECKVIAYNKHANTLDIKFDSYGVRIRDVKKFNGDIVTVKYKGEIGKPNFECKL